MVVSGVRILAEGLRVALREHADIEVTRTTESLACLLNDGVVEWDVVLIADDLASSDGVYWMIEAAAAHAPVVVVEVASFAGRAVGLVEAGVSGFVPRNASSSDLADIIRRAARGEFACGPTIVGSMARQIREMSLRLDDSGTEGSLTERQLQVLDLVDRGLSNKEIACELRIEVSTVKNHVHAILERLGVEGRARAAARVRPVLYRRRARRARPDRPGVSD